MPSVSKKQANLMQAVAHNPKFAKKVGIPVSVGKEFSAKKFQSGGDVKKDNYEFGSAKDLVERDLRDRLGAKSDNYGFGSARDYTLQLEGGGSGNEYGTEAKGTLTATKDIGKNTSVNVGVEGSAFKRKNDNPQGRITGAGFTLTKKFKHGGYIKSKPRGT